jgi:ADP-ribose pyrophosphatase
MHFILLLTLHLFVSPCYAQSEDTHIADYLQLLSQYPQTLGPIGNASQQEIEIVQDPSLIQQIEKTTGRRIGILHKDTYWLLLNDPVKFPNGKTGTYGRILWCKSLQGIAGVAVMPILPNGKIVLNRNYRHATRSWEYELPRGVVNPNESPTEAAHRETQEETGMTLKELHLLGYMAPDTGLTNTVVPLFMATVKEQAQPQPEDSEAIAAVEAFTLQELKQGFLQGYLTITLNNQIHHIPLRDPFLTFALFQMENHQLTPQHNPLDSYQKNP